MAEGFFCAMLLAPFSTSGTPSPSPSPSTSPSTSFNNWSMSAAAQASKLGREEKLGRATWDVGMLKC
eukprot:13126149-Alexandrium_andersonii.AAC.1